MKLSNMQRVFVEEYLSCWNGTEAARRAGYKWPRQAASKNMSKGYILAFIDERRRSHGAIVEDCSCPTGSIYDSTRS